MTYADFLNRKLQESPDSGFDPLWVPDFLFDFQKSLVEWAVRKGRAAIFADCLAGESIIHSPDGDRTIGDLWKCKQAPVVYVTDGKNVTVAMASQPFINGVDRLYRFDLSSGRSITATMGHRFLTSSGWMPGSSLRIGESLAVSDAIRLRSNSEPSQSTHAVNGRHSMGIVQDCQSRYSICLRPYDGQLHQIEDIDQVSSPSPIGAPLRFQQSSRTGVSESISAHSRRYRPVYLPATDHYESLVATTEVNAEYQPPSFGQACTDVNTRNARRVLAGTNHRQPVHELHPSGEQQYEAAREEGDERHQHPLQLDVIERIVVLRSNEGETVLTPFMGVGSEAYGAVINKRKAVGIELKTSYYRQAVRNLASAEHHADQPSLFGDGWEDAEEGDVSKHCEWGGGAGPAAAVENETETEQTE